MAPIHVFVTYDKPTPDYFAGELLSGNVFITLDTPVAINDVFIKVKGKGEVQFTTQEGSGDNKRTVRHYGRENYINYNAMIFQPNPGQTFGRGQHKFPFSVILPTTLPETFRGPYGEVKYKCKAIVKCGERVNFLSHVCKESTPFTVHANFPIHSILLQAQTTQTTKNLPFCCDACCCFSSGKVSGVLTTNKSGYVPGESIAFNAQISNKTRQNLESLTLCLRQTVICVAFDGRTKISYNELNRVASTQGVPAGTDFAWPVSFPLPILLPPTNLGSCRIISVQYMLEADIGENSGCCAPDVHFRIPITIGTAVPSTLASAMPTNMMATAQQPNVYAGFPQPLEPGYPSAQPYLPQPGGYPPVQPGYSPSQPGYPPVQPGFPPSQPGYPPVQPGFSPSQPGYPPVQPGFPPSQPGYSQVQPGYSPSHQPQFPPAYQPGYPQSSEPQMAEFSPSCPAVITEEPVGANPEFVLMSEKPKI